MVSRLRTRPLCAAGLPTLVLLALLLGLAHAPAAAGTSAVGPRAASVDLSAGSLALVVSPASWWMVGGNSTVLSATWTGLPAGCTSEPIWFRWTIWTGWAEGDVSPVNGSTTVFAASSVASGTARVVVHAAVLVVCPSGETAANASAGATVTVVVPPSLGPLVEQPDAALVGQRVNLTGSVANGAPPYRATVDWADGSSSTYTLPSAGPFAWPHRYPAGSYLPRLTVIDSAGFAVSALADEPVSVGRNVTVGLDVSAAATEVGVPDDFTGVVLDPPTSFSLLTACSNSTGISAARTPAPDASVPFACTFISAGVAQVLFEVVPVGDGLPPAEVELSVPVAPTLSVAAELAGPAGEVGTESVVAVTVAGGVAPFALEVRETGGPSTTTTLLASDGTALVPVPSTQAGTLGVTVSVTDALGVVATNASTRLQVVAPLRTGVETASQIAPGGAAVSVAASISAGLAPFSWFVVPSAPARNGTPAEGTLAGVGEFGWQGVVGREGNGSITLGVIDAAGATAWTSLAVPFVPRLGLHATLVARGAGGAPGLWLNLTIAGGLSPFELWVNGSAGVHASWNGSAPADGAFSFAIPPGDGGPGVERLSCVDALGARWAADFAVTPVSSPPPAPGPIASASPAPTSTAVVGVLVLLAAAAGVAILWRRRRERAAASDPAAPDPELVLKRIVAPADGADRATVELLAEEAGLPLAEVHAAIARLLERGTLRSDTGPDGEEVLTWCEPDDA